MIELSKDLRLRRSYAMGHLHALWHNALEVNEDGDLTGTSDELIAEYSDYPGDAPQYVRLLQQHGFLGYRDDGGNLIAGSERLLHDWLDYAGRFLINRYHTADREKLVRVWLKHGKRYGKSTSYTGTKPSASRKVRLGKVRSGSYSPLSPIPPDDSVLIGGIPYKWPSPEGLLALALDPEIWADWIKSRMEKGKPLTATSIRRAGIKLARWHGEGHDLNEIVEHAVVGNWQGLFVVKGRDRGAQTKSDQQADKIQAARRRGL